MAVLGAGLGTLVLLSGCVGGPTVVAEEDFRIGPDTVAVVGFSPQFNNIRWFGSGSHGYLVAIDRDGSSRVLRTAPVAGIAPNWDGDTVYSWDGKVDRATTADGTTSTPRTGDLVQVGSYPGFGEFSSIEQYDLGITKGTGEGKALIRARRADGSTQETNFDGALLNPTVCSDGIYGYSDLLRSRTPPHLVGKPHPYIMIRELPRPNDDHRPQADVIGFLDSADMKFTPESIQGACLGTRVFYLGKDDSLPIAEARVTEGIDPPTEQTSPVYLLSANTATGEFGIRPLTGDRGLPLRSFDASYDSGAFLDGELYWYTDTGTVYATNIDTGATREAFRTVTEPTNVRADHVIDDESLVRFSEGTLYRLSAPPEGARPGTLTSWDLRTGRQLLNIEVPAITEITAEASYTQAPWGLAIRPELLHPRPGESTR